MLYTVWESIPSFAHFFNREKNTLKVTETNFKVIYLIMWYYNDANMTKSLNQFDEVVLAVRVAFCKYYSVIDTKIVYMYFSQRSSCMGCDVLNENGEWVRERRKSGVVC